MITLAQLYDLGLDQNIDIFSGIRLPDDSPMDQTVLINTIIEKCGLNIPLYADPGVMASAISVWSAKNQYTFEHVGKIYVASYSPIENYDSYEDISLDKNRELSDNTKVDSSKNEDFNSENNSKITEGKTSTHSGTDTTTDINETSAYNSSSYQPDNKSVANLTHGERITDVGNGSNDSTVKSNKDTTSNSSQDKLVTEEENTKTITHRHGNIGTTKSTDLEESEYRFIGNYNPYNFLAGLFENELTLFVY